jgi:hypothetical protein
MQAELRARSEPAPYLVVYAAGLEALARQRAIPASMPGGRGKPGIPGDLFTRLQTCLSRPFSDRTFLRVASSTASGAPNPPRESARSGKSEGAGVNPEDERGWWWLTGATSATASALPLTDRIEREIVRSLQKNPVLPFTELEQALCAHFTGLQTPPVEVIRAVLESYGEALPGQPGIWRLRPGDTPAARRADLAAMHHHLTGLGHKLRFTVSSDSGDAYPAVVYWHDSGEPAWSFYLMASSIISRYVLTPPAGAGGQRVLVLPGGRARLLAYKLRRDPRLAEAAAGWRILKYRHLRDLSETAALTRDQWETLLDEDPLTDEASQIRLL